MAQQAFGAAAAPFSAAGRNARMGAKPPPPPTDDFDLLDDGELFKVTMTTERARDMAMGVMTIERERERGGANGGSEN